LSHAKVRSTTHRLGWTTDPLWLLKRQHVIRRLAPLGYEALTADPKRDHKAIVMSANSRRVLLQVP
jgi:hypothetical protein